MSERCQALNAGHKQCRKKAHDWFAVTINCSGLGPVKAKGAVIYLCRDHAYWPEDKRK